MKFPKGGLARWRIRRVIDYMQSNRARDFGLASLNRRWMLGSAGLAMSYTLLASRSPWVVVFCAPLPRAVLHPLGEMFCEAAGAPVRLICRLARIIVAPPARGECNDALQKTFYREALFVTGRRPAGFRDQRGYNWFGGIG